VTLAGIEHMIRQPPREIYIDMMAGRLLSIEAVDADASKQIIKLRDSIP